MKILAIETSCDETAASVVSSEINPQAPNLNTQILSNIIASQIDLHRQYGGVFPEIASRAHAEKIIPVVQKAIGNKDYNVIAVTTGPGLIGSLLVGVNFAKTLAFTTSKPIIGINHWLGHIYSNFTNKIPEFPALILIVSGGHTGLVLMKSHNEIVTLGETLDDAAGEAFDKVAKLLQLGYPGGPAISQAAAKFLISKSEFLNKSQISNLKFPRAMLERENYNFSFSGLKTAVLYKVKELTNSHKLEDISPLIAAEFQQTVIDILIGKTLRAAREFNPKSICLCGGVSANKELRTQMAAVIENCKLKIENFDASFYVPPLSLTTDNAAMIGLAAAYQIAHGKPTTDYRYIDADANQKLNKKTG